MKRLIAIALGIAAVVVWMPLTANAATVTITAGAGANDGSADTFNLVVNGTNVDVSVNGGAPSSYALAGLTMITVAGSSDDDTLTVDAGGGLLAVPGGIHFDGGNGTDKLALVNTGGPTITSSQMVLGPSSGGGKSTMSDGSNTQTVFYDNLEPVVDTVAAATATVNGTNSNNAINYTEGSVPANGLISVDNFETYEFSNKTNLIINGLAGSDAVNLNDPTTPTGLTGTITVNGSDPTSAGDTLTVNGIAGVLDNLRDLPSAAGAGTVVNDNGPQPNVLYTGIEGVHMTIQHADGDGVRVDGTTGNDNIQYFHGPTDDTGTFNGTMDTNNATGSGPFAMPETTFSGASPLANDTDVNFFNPGGTDSFVFNGTAESDTIQVAGGEAGGTEFRDTINGQVVSRVEVFNAASGLVRGLGGDDVFNDSPTTLTGTPVTFQGGSGTGDVLNYTPASGSATTVDLGAGTITSTAPAQAAATFTGVERVNETSSGVLSTLTVNGTAGPDAFDFTPTSGTGGIVSRPVGPLVTFTGVGSTFTLNPLAGADTVTVEGTPGVDTINEVGVASASAVTVGGLIAMRLPNATTEALMIKGGLGDDTLNVNSSGAPLFTPTTYDGSAGSDGVITTGDGSAVFVTFGGTPRITGGGTTQLNLQSVQTVSADVGGNDLSVFGTAADDQFSYQPLGAASGQVTRNGGLPDLNFANAGSLTIDPLGGNDSVQVQGTSAGDTFTTAINPTATVQVGGLLTASVPTGTTELLKLWGATGADTFNITTFNTASMNVAVDGDLPSKKGSADVLKVITTSNPVKVKKIKTGKTTGIVNVDYKTTGASIHITHSNIETVKT